MINFQHPKPHQLINWWIHVYDLSTVYGCGLQESIHKYDTMGRYWQERVRNWKDLIQHNDIHDSPEA